MSASTGEVLLPRPRPVADRWVQLGLAPAGGALHPLHGVLASLARDWHARGVVENFFFMHKPPGLRVRFAPAPGLAPFVRNGLAAVTRGWFGRGLLARTEPGTYEPEQHLFGGSVSMDHVHRLFTADALTWLEYHAAPREAPTWALSLAMLRPLFDAMDLSGPREQAVWARVGEAGRVVPPGVGTATAEDGLRRWWQQPDELPPDVRELADRYADRVAPLAATWAHSLRGADISGPVAWYVVFHWNRAALTFGRQAMLTGALAGAGDER